MASPVPMGRACRGCNQLKVRCQPSQADPTTCERCLHAGRDCVPAGKRRRPRDRIAELEAQVASLSKALQQQRVSSQASDATGSEPGSSQSSGNTNAVGEDDYDVLAESSTGTTTLAFLDARVPMATQQHAFDMYARDCFPIIPASSILDSSLMTLREEKPVLFFSVVAFTASHLLSERVRDELVGEAMRIFAMEAISRPSRRLDLVWALLVAGFWFRARLGNSHVTIHQLTQLATGMAVDIGIGGTHLPITPGAGGNQTSYPSSRDSQRAWLTCYIAASNLAIGIRRPDTNAQWTSHHDNCLTNLSTASNATGADRLFLHLVRGEKLGLQVAEAVGLCDPTRLWDITTDESQIIVANMQKDIDNWTAEACSNVDHKPLLFYRYSAIICLHESVLHTYTNKWTFGAPFRPDKVADSDFPCPAVTGKHVAALYALRDSCHAALDLATEPSITTFLECCPLTYITRVFYALFVLVKLYISVTAAGNSYGAVLRSSELRLHEYLERMRITAATVQERNPGSFNARILGCSQQLSEWLKVYACSLERAPTDGFVPTDNQDWFSETSNIVEFLTAFENGGIDNEEFGWLILDNHSV